LAAVGKSLIWMRTLGIIGGTGPETTVEYYRRLIAGFRAQSPEGRAPSLVINSIDNKKVVDLVTANELGALTDYLVAEMERLARAGAELGLIAANTPHLVFDEVQRRSQIPMLSIVTVTCEAAARAGLRHLALFGTRFTMQAAFSPEIFQQRQITTVVPNEIEQAYIPRQIHERAVCQYYPAGNTDRIGRNCAGDEGSRQYRRTNSRRDRVVIDLS